MPHPLDNPIWESLSTRHAPFAVSDPPIKRYPKTIGPFAGIASDSNADPEITAGLAKQVLAGDLVYFLGELPTLNDEWQMHHYDPLPQMICEAPLKHAGAGPEIIELTERHRPDMLALTALVYPGYFRERTPDIGNYLGIYQKGQLAAIAGERMHCHEFLEMSAICTHPDFLGRGYAHHLLAALTHRTLERGLKPFLHVSRENVRARAVYERLGYRERVALPFMSVCRR